MIETLDKARYIAVLESEVRRVECDCHRAQQRAEHDRQSLDFLQAKLQRTYQALDTARATAVAARRRCELWAKRARFAQIVAGVEGIILILGVMAWVAYR